ncbi:hypothetical protein QTO34_016977 [Cnephaeus nilssonii]|uniref:Regulatory factor X-associated protein RFXANK-binding domain-containing protein n=1 Tax=Cnephaeus nilssonii TaxID=3371016 RepID=A0AA40I388_CNENI|nr:hypothetical protein QTO34_016977 [Eptesicus nilssonii]
MYKMAIVNPQTSIISLNVNDLNSPIKRHSVAEWIKTNKPYAACKRHIYAAKTKIGRPSDALSSFWTKPWIRGKLRSWVPAGGQREAQVLGVCWWPEGGPGPGCLLAAGGRPIAGGWEKDAIDRSLVHGCGKTSVQLRGIEKEREIELTMMLRIEPAIQACTLRIKLVCKTCTYEGCSETTSQVAKQRKPWMCKKHRNKMYKDKYKKKKSDQALNCGGAGPAGSAGSVKLEESAESILSIVKQRTGALGDRPARPTLLEQVLNQKRLSLLRSPEVVQFLQKQQQLLNQQVLEQKQQQFSGTSV